MMEYRNEGKQRNKRKIKMKRWNIKKLIIIMKERMNKQKVG